MNLEGRFIGLHQPHLANSRHCLQFVQCVRALLAVEPLHACRHRTRSHQYHLGALFTQPGDLVRPATNGIDIQARAIGCQQRATNLDDATFYGL